MDLFCRPCLIPKYEIHMIADAPNWLRHLVNQISQAQNLKGILNEAAVNLSAFLEIDRVNICQLQPDDTVQVIAEVIHDNRLPSLLSTSLPLDDFLPHSREQFLQFRVGAVANLERRTIVQIRPQNFNPPSAHLEMMNLLPLSARGILNFADRGVHTSLVMPIFQHKAAWGLLVAHHAKASFISTRKLEVLQMAVDQLSVAVTQDALRIQVQARTEQETVLNRINTLLQSDSKPEFQAALEVAVKAFQGSGGRLCMRDPDPKLASNSTKDFAACLASSEQGIKVYTSGIQPQIPAIPHSTVMEQYRLWQDHYQSGDYSVWPISNLYQIPELQPLFEAFRPTPIDRLLMIPLTYRQQLVGYLSIFRNSTGSKSPQIEQGDSGQLAQGQDWTGLESAQKLGRQFAMQIYQQQLSQPLHHSNPQMNTEFQQQSTQLQQVTQQQKGLSEVLAKIRAAVDPETIFQTTTKELCQLLKSERVSVYRFNVDWGGEFVHDFEYVTPNWHRSSKLGRNTAWNDTYLQETQGGRYRHNEVFFADDIHQANLSPCHVEILEQFQIKAFATAPVFVGKRLWGVLAAYQHSQSRHWLDTDILFLSQTAASLGIALQQAELLAQTQRIIR